MNNDISQFLKMKLSNSVARRFVDALRIYARGGSGGMGFPRYGGVGGKGGDVLVKVIKGTSLQNLMKRNPGKRFAATDGGNSRNFQLYGESGTDLIIEVPEGVSVMSEMGTCMGEVNREEDHVVVARGGAGGCVANNFCGEAGQRTVVRLELKLIADIGLVGFPNAGKSTLLQRISRAKPKIAAYPFTTLRPQLGVMQYNDFRRISLADLPGLIEGAHKNVGLGHRFLRHVERTKLLLLVVDVSGFRLGPRYPWRSALETIVLLNKELELYKEELLQKPAVLAINKLDLPGAKEAFVTLSEQAKSLKDVACDSFPRDMLPNSWLEFSDIVGISAACDKKSVLTLKRRLREVLDDLNESTNQKDGLLIENSREHTGKALV